MMKALCYAIFACAFNLLLGYTGLLSFGHAAFFGAAAYITGWLVTLGRLVARDSACSAAPASPACSAWSVGLIAIRRQGIYFAMITLAMAQMVYFVWLQASFTGGENGLQGVPRGKLPLRPRRFLSLPERPGAVLRRSSPSSSPCSCSSSASSIRPSARC